MGEGSENDVRLCHLRARQLVDVYAEGLLMLLDAAEHNSFLLKQTFVGEYLVSMCYETTKDRELVYQ